MFSHVMVGANDVVRAKRFYDAIFKAIGGRAGITNDKGRVIYMHQESVFAVGAPRNGEAASAGNGCTIGFALESPAQVRAWQDAGVAAGGSAVEDPAGVRTGALGQLYLAYLRDPDGNKLCGLHRMPAAEMASGGA